MEVTVNLTSAIWKPGELRRAVNTELSNFGTEAEAFLKANIDESTPAGRLYRRDRITTRRTKALDQIGIKRVKGRSQDRTRSLVGFRFHRASAWGQPPARDTSRLYRSIRVRRVGNDALKFSVNAPGVKWLDSKTYLNRLFFKSKIRQFTKEKFQPGMLAILRELKRSR